MCMAIVKEVQMDTQLQITKTIGHSKLFIYAFWKAVSIKLESTGYVQLEKYFGHYSQKDRRDLLKEIQDSQIERLLIKSVASESEFLHILQKIESIDIPDNILFSLSQTCCKAIISWLFYCCKQRYLKAIRTELARESLSKSMEYILVDDKYIIKADIDYYVIENLKSFIEVILGLVPKGKIFYRGQSSLNYWIQPSISRSNALLQNEAKLYQELVLRCPSDFEKCKSHLDFLVEMQHYGLPTRLVDITTNPLVALFFSASGKDDADDGEVIIFDIPEVALKYEGSDTVTILSCLPLFQFEDQQELLSLSNMADIKSFNEKEVVLRLLHEIRSDKPSFTGRICPTDLCKNLVVTPSMKNNRITKQSGAFIICGLANNYSLFNPLEMFRYYNTKKQKLLLIIKNKKILLRELRAFDIHSATLFPEIDDVANYLKGDWLN